MINWVLSIAGMSFLGVVIDTLIPGGKIGGYVKGVFSLFLMYIVISPLPKLFNMSVDIKTNYEYEENTNFLETINSKKLENYKVDILDKLKDQGISNILLDFDADITKSDIDIKKVRVDIQNIVLNNNAKHININDTIQAVLESVLGIKGKEVVIYGQSNTG